MTIFLRALYGPFGPHTDAWVGLSGARYAATQIDWHFNGIREDNSVGHWSIRFTLKTRKWQSVNYPLKEKAGPIVNPDAFVPDKPMVYGPTYLTILKARLSKEDIAFASRLALEQARR